jgi:hypothetical protein
MNGETDFAQRPILKRLISPWGIAAVILTVFFLGEAYLAWRDRAVDSALENDPTFSAPAFDLSFSKKIPYDPLAFTGRGAQAGLWRWSQDGLILTDEGRKYFEESGEMFVSHTPAGKRRIKRIRTNTGTRDGDRRVEFIYEWTEVSPPATALLVHPPLLKEDYPGEAVLTHERGYWTVKSLRTLDFEEPMTHLKEIASGVRK